MSWFGGGKKNNDNHETDSTEERGFSDQLSSPYPSSMSNNMYGGTGAPGASSSGLQEFQEFSIALQQQVLVQTVITDLTQKAFSKCCSSSTTSTTLTGKEAACISAITNKWLDSNEFLAGRLQRKQQQQGGSSFG
jgi:Tim10/DDP family zinc finger